MAEKKEPKTSRIISSMRNQFLIGLVVAVPLVVTYLVLAWLFNTVDNVLQPLIRLFTGYSLPGAGLVATIVLIYIIGIISSNVFGKQLIRYGESVLYHIPGVGTLYSSVKQVIESFSSNGKNNLLHVVLVEYPSKGIMSLAFVTCETTDKAGKKLLSLLIPTAPNPLSGFVIVVPEEEVIRTNIKMDAAMRMMISFGAVMPPDAGNGRSNFSCPEPAKNDGESAKLETSQNTDR